MLVMKFGGTSLGNAERITAVAEIVKARLDKKPVVVVSAVAGVTNALIAVANEKSKDTRVEMLEAIQSVHNNILNELGVAVDLLDAEFIELTKLVKSAKKVDKKILDQYVSFGERLCAPILAAALRKMDINAKAYPAWELGMITDDTHGAAEPLPTSGDEIRSKILALKAVPIITGYIGKTRKGSITTLGRGGSDYTAAIIGAALKAESIQIWKEVDGIMSTDPRMIPEAKVLSELAFEEAAELAYFGAKVLHPKTILPAITAGVPVQVLNTFKPDGRGTTIVANFEERREKSQTIEAIAFRGGRAVVNLSSVEFFDGTDLMSDIFDLFYKKKVSVDLIALSVAGVSFAMAMEDAKPELLKSLERFGKVRSEQFKAIICAVGGSLDSASTSGKLFSILGENGIKAEMISQAASGHSITFVVNEDDAERAVKILHKAFITN